MRRTQRRASSLAQARCATCAPPRRRATPTLRPSCAARPRGTPCGWTAVSSRAMRSLSSTTLCSPSSSCAAQTGRSPCVRCSAPLLGGRAVACPPTCPSCAACAGAKPSAQGACTPLSSRTTRQSCFPPRPPRRTAACSSSRLCTGLAREASRSPPRCRRGHPLPHQPLPHLAAACAAVPAPRLWSYSHSGPTAGRSESRIGCRCGASARRRRGLQRGRCATRTRAASGQASGWARGRRGRATSVRR
mmetsp:Transcript_13528/g.32048  ORF Transcript_13528/g.32048 Transcript_13528/m.32048 type:complete len:247 (+) Transcript_13528:826-1566(+)